MVSNKLVSKSVINKFHKLNHKSLKSFGAAIKKSLNRQIYYFIWTKFVSFRSHPSQH